MRQGLPFLKWNARALACAALLPAVPAAAFEFPWARDFHYQGTVIDQGHFGFHSPYEGANSLRPAPERAVSVTSTLFLGLRPLPGTELYADPELAGGRGVGGTAGVAGFPNGEIYRVGDPQPTISAARLFARRTFGLGGGREKVDEGQNQIAGERDVRRVTLTAGKFALGDLFDGNAYAHDPRSQFFNWALMDSAAWDYPADTRGYTWGAAAEYNDAAWAARVAAVAEPKEANRLDMDRRIGRAHGLALEGERRWTAAGRKGAARLLAFLNEARMGSYAQALARPGTPDVAATRGYGRTKYGFALSADQQLAEDFGAFARLSWSDGRNETWAFTEVDASAALGLDLGGGRWGRAEDGLGAAVVVNGLSDLHRRYLSAGGAGFLIGDGALHYGPEAIFEAYYRWKLNAWASLSPDAQLVVNPGYNRARGPVEIWGLRFHVEL